MKKSIITLLPLLLVIAALALGILWLGYSFKQDQQQAFQVVESGWAEQEERLP